MIMSALVVGVSAAPEKNCLKFDESGVYAYFNRFSTNANNSKISFDMAMAQNSEGNPVLSINSGAVTITNSYVQIGSTQKNINWGTAELKHWRKIEIAYSGGSCTLSIDGIATLTVSGQSCRTDGLIMIGWPGDIYIDNLKVDSAGVTVLDLNFEDETTYLNHKSSDSSVTRTTVPEGSYYDYEEVIVPDDVQYVFDNVISCENLVVSPGEGFLVGDLNSDGALTAADYQSFKALLAGNAGNVDASLVDFDSDGKATTSDSLLFRQVLTGEREQVYGTTASATAEYSSSQKSAKLTATSATSSGADATLKMDKIGPDAYKYAVITYMTPASSDDYNSGAAVQSAFGAYGNFVTYDLVNDGKFHSQTVDLSEMSTWNGDTATLRFFVGANAGDTIYIDSIVFTATYPRAVAAKTAREAAKTAYGIYDEPDGKIGYLDEAGNYVIRFDQQYKLDLAVFESNNSRVSLEGDSLKAVATAGSDPSIYIDLDMEGISANTYKYITYTYMIPTTTKRNDPRANIYYVCGDVYGPTPGYETPVFNCVKNNAYANVVIDLSSAANWSGDIHGLRVDFFTDCSANDTAYIDSIIFSKASAEANKASQERQRERNGGSAGNMTVQEVWNAYRNWYTGANSNEYVYGSGTNVQMYFRYNTDASKFTARSLGDRMARAISEATGCEVECSVYSGFVDLKSNFSKSSSPSGNIYYTLKYNGRSYVVYVPTTIIKDASYTDVLDGTSADVDPYYPSTSTWFEGGVSATDTVALPTSTTGLAYHSNHETRIVDTPYGTFAVIPMSADESSWATLGKASYTIFRIYDDGSTKSIGSGTFAYHTSKPNIMYAADGMVYVVCPDDQGSAMSVLIQYFDPSKPNSDGSYNIQGGSRTNLAYNGGAAPGGYGYLQPVLDDTNGKIYVIACGGSTTGYFAWRIYNYKTHSWESASYSTTLDSYRHCYIYAYSDGASGIYLVAGRDVLLSTLGLAGIVYGADYAWDEVNLFHFPNMYSTGYTRTTVNEADYTQQDRELFPVTANNRNGDTFLDSDGHLHVLSSTTMHGRYHHDNKYVEMWHAVYDVSTPGMKPVELYNEPIAFVSPTNFYSMRMTESTSGVVYILAVPSDKSARCEIWREKDSNAFEFEMVGCRSFSDSAQCLTSLIIGNNRNGSVVDNTVSCFYPADKGSGNAYRYFTVTLP